MLYFWAGSMVFFNGSIPVVLTESHSLLAVQENQSDFAHVDSKKIGSFVANIK